MNFTEALQKAAELKPEDLAYDNENGLSIFGHPISGCDVELAPNELLQDDIDHLALVFGWWYEVGRLCVYQTEPNGEIKYKDMGMYAYYGESEDGKKINGSYAYSAKPEAAKAAFIAIIEAIEKGKK
jgi:hypothetical protein